MGDLIKTNGAELANDIVSSLVLDGDLGRMRPEQRVAYYVHRCRMLGIDPGEQPFQLVKLNGKLVMYATKTCANALTRVNGLSVEIKSTRIDGSLVIVEARAADRHERFADDVGVIDFGEERLSKPNAIMKAVTKAKRRAVLSLVGLGVLDETEVENIRGAERVEMAVDSGEIIDTTATPAEAKDEPSKLDVFRQAVDEKVDAYAKRYRLDLGTAWGEACSLAGYPRPLGGNKGPWGCGFDELRKIRDALKAAMAAPVADGGEEAAE